MMVDDVRLGVCRTLPFGSDPRHDSCLSRWPFASGVLRVFCSVTAAATGKQKTSAAFFSSRHVMSLLGPWAGDLRRSFLAGWSTEASESFN